MKYPVNEWCLGAAVSNFSGCDGFELDYEADVIQEEVEGVSCLTKEYEVISKSDETRSLSSTSGSAYC